MKFSPPLISKLMIEVPPPSTTPGLAEVCKVCKVCRADRMGLWGPRPYGTPYACGIGRTEGPCSACSVR